LVARSVWDGKVKGSNPLCPTHKSLMKMNKELNKLEEFTIEEFHKNFDNLLNRVENGESFIIKSEHGNAVMVPYKDVVGICEEANVDFEEIVKIHTDHEEGS
jgi:antitoxin (DNA-binding transcriptional repressor) of toxin-antitoxin stability system